MAIGKQRSRRRRSRAGFILSVLFFVGFLLASVKGYELLFDYAKSEQTFPISRVTVEGEFEFLTKEEIIDTVAKIAAGKNLVALDLAPVHNALLRMPWVSKVSVKKKMPDTLSVVIEEHHASARWRNSGYYDALSESVFYPDMQRFNLPLVTLSAQHDTLASGLYAHAAKFIEMTKGTQYMIREVHLDATRGYRILLEGDVWLILGRAATEDMPFIRLKRFILAFPQTKLKLSEISYVDLRYVNGFAVGDRNPPETVVAQ